MRQYSKQDAYTGVGALALSDEISADDEEGAIPEFHAKSFDIADYLPRRRKKTMVSKVLDVFQWVIIVLGIILLAKPVVTDWLSAKKAADSISEISSVYDDMDDPDRMLNLEQAQRWNAKLHGIMGNYDDLWDYDTQLTYRGTPSTMMSYLDIPKISTTLPVYHHTTDDVLMAGVGHIEWSDLPVGGSGTRCLLSGHSGMQNTRMFDDIRRLEIGDIFVVWTLSEPYAYKVCDIDVIDPEDVDKCKAEVGRDLCSLITCTPYNVNTHRLVVTGERTEYSEEDPGRTRFPEAYLNRRTWPLIIGIFLLIGLFVFLIYLGFVKKQARVDRAWERALIARHDALSKEGREDLLWTRIYGMSKQPQRLKKKFNLKQFLYRSWPYALMLFGLIALSRPIWMDMFESYTAQQGISVATDTYNAMEDEQRQKVMREAQSYNQSLLLDEDVSKRVPYEQQLSYGDSEMIAYLSIPSISVELPIFHGTSDNVLMVGVGHMEETPLPIGTKGGRCVLAAHSGMANARMFDDIHLLKNGDRFVVWTLGIPYAYEVVDSTVVLPEESEHIANVPGEDLVTLVTCTPYRVNTHRLLVTGRRCEYIQDEEIVPQTEVYINRRTIPLLLGLLAIMIVGSVGVVLSANKEQIRIRRRIRILQRVYKRGGDVFGENDTEET